MSDIKLTEGESALWNEVGSRGDLFRAAMRDRAHEHTRVSGRMTEICDPLGRMLDAVQPADPVAEKVYDDESVREVASLPTLHKGEPPIPVGDVWPVDSGKEIAGELHENEKPPGPYKRVVHAVGDLVHKAEERLHAPPRATLRHEPKQS